MEELFFALFFGGAFSIAYRFSTMMLAAELC
jgi:hypothetical protein